MALQANEEMRNGVVVDATTGYLVVAGGTVVQIVNGLPTDADGRVVIAS